jgi:hypothetical protein
MVNGRKRSRSLNWSHEETMLLAELKREAFLNKEEGGLVWQRIAQTISSRFPNKTRSDDQCRRRWDTLRKDYNHIEEYCIETGQDHWQLEEEELASMKLNTAYRQDWYDIVRQVCSHRKRKERGDRDLIVAKQSKRSETDSHSAVFPEPTPGRVTLCATPPASTSEPVSFIPLQFHFLEYMFVQYLRKPASPVEDVYIFYLVCLRTMLMCSPSWLGISWQVFLMFTL